MKALAVAPAAPALVAQQPAAQSPAPESPALIATAPDIVAEGAPRFFAPAQFAALKKVSDLLMPALNGMAGALDAGAPEFLDFLIGESPADRQQIYRAGLDGLNLQARQRFHKDFGELDASQAETLLAPLHQPWTYDLPADPVAAFLRAAKQDVRTATVNSREYGAASGGGRRFGGAALYWYPLD